MMSSSLCVKGKIYPQDIVKQYFRWRDTRLKYSQSDYEKVLEGESWLADKIWTPNIYIENEVASEIMSTIQDSVQVMISPSGSL